MIGTIERWSTTQNTVNIVAHRKTVTLVVATSRSDPGKSGSESSMKAPQPRTEVRRIKVSISITPELKERLQLFAEANNWSISSAASWLLEKSLKEHVAPRDILKKAVDKRKHSQQPIRLR